MKIKHLTFPGYVFGQSGVQGFFGEGDEYPHHAFYKYIPGFSFKGMVFVAKTVTEKPRIYPESSNTELRDGYKIKHLFPSSIWCSIKSFIGGYLLNAVGLANPGIFEMFQYGKWQKRTDVFQLSVMLMESELSAKLREAQYICTMIRKYLPNAEQRYAVQINFSCPNTGHAQTQDADNIIEVLKVFRAQLPQIVLIPKFDLLVEPETVSRAKQYCDAFCIANTIPFGKKKEERWWKQFFTQGSPLKRHFNGKFEGGLSGAPLFPVLIDWLEDMQKYDPTVSIIAGGGIMKKKDIEILSRFKIVKGVALGSVAILRPWRVQSLITFGNRIFSSKH